MVSTNARRERIADQVATYVDRAIEPALLNELVFLVEWPDALKISFDEKYDRIQFVNAKSYEQINFILIA